MARVDPESTTYTLVGRESNEPSRPSLQRVRRVAAVALGFVAAALALFMVAVYRHDGRVSMESMRSFTRLYCGMGGGASGRSLSWDGCPKVTTEPGFNLDAFISRPWYIQQQMEVQYQSKENLNCVKATYARKQADFWGHTIQVRNYGQSDSGEIKDSKTLLCASPQDPVDPAKLQVGPCFLPRILGFTTGQYWVLAYNEAEGYALISGGQPSFRQENGGISTDDPGGCRTGSGTNNAGLWIFTRERMRNEYLVQKVRSIAKAKGFDLSVLLDVDQTNCLLPGY